MASFWDSFRMPSLWGTPIGGRKGGRHRAGDPGRQRQAVGRGRSQSKYPGIHVGPRQNLDGSITPGYSGPRGRGVGARVQMRSRTGGQVHSGHGRFAGVRHFGWHTAPKMGG